MAEKVAKLVVRFNQQQLQLLDSLKKEGNFGETYSEIVRNVFREYVKEELGKGGA